MNCSQLQCLLDQFLVIEKTNQFSLNILIQIFPISNNQTYYKSIENVLFLTVTNLVMKTPAEMFFIATQEFMKLLPKATCRKIAPIQV